MAKKQKTELEENQIKFSEPMIYEGKIYAENVVHTVDDEDVLAALRKADKRVRKLRKSVEVNNPDGATTSVLIPAAPLPPRVKAPKDEEEQVDEARKKLRGVSSESDEEEESDDDEDEAPTRKGRRAKKDTDDDDEEEDEEESDEPNLNRMKADELRALATEKGVKGDIDSMTKAELIEAIENE